MAKRDGCPICGNPPSAEVKPFCGRGCKDRDLLQWLGEGYKIPGEAVDPSNESGLDRRGDAD